MQFSITSASIATLLIAMICSFFFVLSDETMLDVIYMLMPLVLAILISLIVFGERPVKAFAIGALVCLTSLAFVSFYGQSYVFGIEFKSELARVLLLCTSAGLISFGIERLARVSDPERAQAAVKSRTSPLSRIFPCVVFAMLVGGLVAYFGVEYQSSRAVETRSMPNLQLGPVVVVITSMEPGDKINLTNITVENWPVKIIPVNAFSDPDDVVGGILTRQMSTGIPLTRYDVEMDGADSE